MKMKKLILAITVCLVSLIAQAQPMGRPMGGGRPPMGGPMNARMGGANKPFYELESDSIAEARITDVAGRLDLTEKQFDKMVKLYAQEFEELCRNLQTTVMEYQMRANGGFGGRGNMGMQAPQTEVKLDTDGARKIYDQIIEKYDKRYKKALQDNQYATWKELPGTTLDNKFSSILQHVQENTSIRF